MTDTHVWWKHGVIYQIYPRSFMDGNGDGVGDLQGVITRLDYLVALGIDAIWLSPIYPSPMADFGYDVSDYTGVHPLFGSMDDFDQLLDAAHARGLRVVLDFVPNHSSDEHPWFIESRSSRDNAKRDWYIWRDAKPDGSPPNNWEAFFGGSAWEWDAATEQYYLHLFLKEQPDLNWANPDVVEAMHDVLRFWLDKGVDGFRMDVVGFLMKHPDMPDNPPLEPVEGAFDWQTENKLQHKYDIHQPAIHEKLRGFRALFDAYDGDRVTIGEMSVMPPEELVTYYGDNDELHQPFNFAMLHRPWDAGLMRAALAPYYAALPDFAWPNVVLGNHDVHRLASRFGVENHRAAALLLLTLRGTPTMYYGDEIGMTRVHVPREKMQDPWGISMPNVDVSRDPARTPMQWTDAPNAGFCPAGVEPWLPVGDNLATVSVAAQDDDPDSTLNLYRRLLTLRREYAALHRGDLRWVDALPEDVLGYIREAEGEAPLLVLINFGGEMHTLDVSAVGEAASLLVSTRPGASDEIDLTAFALHPHEGVLLRVG